MKNVFYGLLATTVALLSSSYVSYGASGSWSGSADATWANSSNWSATPAPGTGDTATFNATVTNGNGTTTPVAIDSGRLVKSITFDTAAASAYTIGTTSGNALTLNTGGAITVTAAVVTAQTINAPLIIGGTSASTYSFTNNSITAGASLNFGGVINGAATTGNTLLTLSGSSTVNTNTISGVIGNGSGGGTLGLAITNSTWALTNSANGYTGGTSLSGGTLLLGNNTAMSSGTLTVSAGTFAASTALSGVTNNLVDTGTFTIGGSNAITFTGSLTNSGNNRTLTVNNTATTTFSGNSIYLSELAGTGRTLTINGSGSIVVNDVISDFNGSGAAGGLTYSGTGSLTLGAANTYSGATSLSSGNLLLNNAGALGSGAFTITGGAIDNITGSPLTLTNNPAVTLGGNFAFLGSNSLNLGTGAVSLTGGRTITLGAFGSPTNVNLTFGGVASNTTTSAITTTVNEATGAAGDAVIFNNGFNLEASSGTGGIVDIFAGSGNITINGGVANGSATGANGLTYSGTGILTLTNASTYTGNTTLSSGTLILGNSSAIGTTGTFTASGGTLAGSVALALGNNFIDNGTMTLGGTNNITLNGTFTETNGANRTLTINNTGTTTLAGNVFLSDLSTTGRTLTINGTGSETINGVIANFNGGAGTAGGLTYNPGSSSAVLTLTNNNTYSGTTTVSNGTLTTTLATSGTPFGTGALTLNEGTINFAPSGSGAVAYTVNGGVFSYGDAAISLNHGSASSLSVTLGTGTSPTRLGQGLLVISPSSTTSLGTTEQVFFAGVGPTVTNGMINATIVGLGATTAGMGDFLTYGANGLVAATANYTNHSTSFSTTTGEISNVTGNVTITPATAIRGLLVQNGDTATINGSLSFVGTSGQANGIILNGGTITGGTITDPNFTELDIYSFDAPTTINSNINIATGNNGTPLVFGGNQTLTLNGALTCPNGSGNVTITSGGLTLAGTEHISSGLTVAGGTLNLNNNDLVTLGKVTVGSYATSTLTENAVNALTGSASLVLSNGTVTLSQANNYTGATTVSGSGSTLNLTATGAISGSALSISASTLNLNAAGALTGTSSLAVSGAGTTVNITQLQNYTGNTTIGGSGGAASNNVNVSGSGGFGNTAITVNGPGAVLNLGAAGAITQNVLNVIAGGTINETADDAISGTASIVMIQAASGITLSRANNYTGATILYSGGNPPSGFVLDFTQGNSPVNNIINNGITNIATGSTLELGGGRLIVNGKAGVTNGQAFNGLIVLGGGASVISDAAGTGGAVNLALNAITRQTGGTVDLSASGGGGITTTSSNFNGTPSGGQQTILGGWATDGGTTWATVGAGGVITGLGSSGYSILSHGGESASQGLDVEAGGYSNNVSGLSAINSLRLNSAGTTDMLLQQDLTIATGGILVNTTNANVIEGNVNLTSGNGQDLIMVGNGNLEIDSNIIDNPTLGSIGLTKSGTGTLTLGGNNTFTGLMTINGGTVLLAAGDANALNGAPVVMMGNTSVGVGALSLNGNSVTVSGIETSMVNTVSGATNSPAVIQNASATAAVLTVNNTNNYTYDGFLQDGTGGGSLGLTKNGTGTLTLTGAGKSSNLYGYTGATIINAGELYLADPTGQSSLSGTTSITVNGGASFGAKGSDNVNIGNTTTFTGMTVAAGSTTATQGVINLADGLTPGASTGAFKISGQNSTTIPTLVLGGTAGNSSVIDFDIGSTSDSIAVTGTGARLSVGAGGFIVNLSGLGNLPGSTITLISSSGFVTGSTLSTFVGNVGAGTPIVLGITTGNFDGYTVALVGTATALQLSETANVLGSTTVYYTGNNSVGGTVTGGTSAWSSFTGGNANNSNFALNSASGPDANQQAGAGTNLHFGLAPTNVTALANYTSNTLGGDVTINSLTYDSAVTGNITTSGNNNLTIAAGTSGGNTLGNGITDSATSGTQTISTNLLTMGVSQTWTVGSGANLVVNSGISDGANNLSLTKAGTGSLTLGGINAYAGGTVVSAGTLYANNAISSTGSGLVSVASTGILSGLGTIRPLAGNSSSIGISVASGATLAPGGAQTGSIANGNLTLDTSKFNGTVGLNLASGAGLTFALGASGSSSSLIVGATTIALNNNVVTINDLVGSSLSSGEYMLIDGNASTIYQGLTTSGIVTPQGQLITGGLSLLAAGTPGNTFADLFGNSALFLTAGNDIEIEVVPEPGTWAMMLAGFALLIFLQRRNRKLD